MVRSWKIHYSMVALASALALPACVVNLGDTDGNDPTEGNALTEGNDPTEGNAPTEGDPTEGDDPYVGRWAGVTVVDDLVFADGMDVHLDEVFVLDADGTMRGDFSGWDEASRCVVTYRLAGTYDTTGDTVDVAWDSIRVAVFGCIDESSNQEEEEVDAEEFEIWDSELDGAWAVDGDVLTIGAEILYNRVESPLVGRWEGATEVNDFTFADGRDVTLNELFWMNDDGSMAGSFYGGDPDSGCNVDYRMTGSWSVDEPDALSAEWESISLETWGCFDESLNEGPIEVVDEEGDIWDDELDGDWEVSGDQLIIASLEGDITYDRDL